jgi:hypothetical protein
MKTSEIMAKIARNNIEIKRLREQADSLYGENYRLNRELREREKAVMKR